MRIKKLSLQNFKGRTRDVELGPINVVHGPNWAGKTAILTAIRVGLLGYEPKLGKRPGDTFQLATGDAMAVDLTFDTDERLERAFRMTRGSVKSTTFFGKPDTGIRCGEPPAIPSMLLDVRDYFGLTAQARRDHVLSMLDLKEAGLSDDALTASMKSMTFANHGAEHEAEIREIVEEFDFWCGDRDARETPLVDWMSGNVEHLKERIAKHGSEIVQCTALLQTIAQERAANPSGTPPDQESFITKLEAELATLAGNYGVMTTALSRWSQRQQIEKQLAGMTDMSSELDRLKGEFEKARVAAGTHEATARAASSAAQAIRQAQSSLDGLRGMHSNVAAQYNALEERFIKESKFDKCPTCGSEEHVPAMKKKLKKNFEEAAKPMRENIKTLAHQIADAEVELDRLTKESASSGAISGPHTLNTLVNKAKVAETAFAHVERQVNAREKLKAQLEGYADAVDPGDMSSLTESMVKLRTEIEFARGRQKSRALLLEREAQAADAEKRKGSCEARQAVAKAALKSIQAAQQVAIDGAYAPFLSAVRRFTDGVLGFSLEYRDGDIGYVKDGTWVGHETFSGSEQALTYAGLGVALASKSPVKIVMIDEVLLMPTTKTKLLEKMHNLISDGVIDQFVAVDVSPDDWMESVCKVNFVDADARAPQYQTVEPTLTPKRR